MPRDSKTAETDQETALAEPEAAPSAEAVELADLKTLLAEAALPEEAPADTLVRLSAAQQRVWAGDSLTASERFKLTLHDVLAEAGETDPEAASRLVLAQIAEWARGTFNIPHKAALALMRLAEE